MAVNGQNILARKDGLSTIESVVLMSVFVTLLSFAIGGFGIVHTSIHYSIAARAYTFEVFRNRSDLTYFRDTPGGLLGSYKEYGFRAHGVNFEGEDSGGNPTWRATRRALSIPSRAQQINPSGSYHAEKLSGPANPAREQAEVDPVWIKAVYGICLDARCGDQGGAP
ncbi:MAG: hypothetical protein COT74_05435 [Bdellovibrionales bacterium CG10_big_fil_rev_8_21_14_0_10_45_34]|nr:MAG: hypothetical protein COT74_05435 [Bdellovibrionales bacterium CG10_big_fil_rev_8_21_14_0_10_45_34]